ncbi:MAG: sigma 54-interacting transcriptional regulator [Planctomycetales bacterium]|nr:sigma 54-interacting transcriptional regulator [Planctomycetales bacterium]MBN8626513.1 sigma 54-interacting transcriptional regulator [Planctomycetota bacterium]
MSPRPRHNDLARFFNAAADPFYVVDDERRIIYLNEACAKWLGCKPVDLLGRECRYTSIETDDYIQSLVNSLCPPPQTFAGETARAEIIPPHSTEAQSSARIALFQPWSFASSEGFGVSAWLPPREYLEREDAAAARAVEEAARLRAQTLRIRRETAGRYSVDRLIGIGPSMQRVRAQIEVAGVSKARLSIIGPVGSGRSRIARAVHYFRPQGAPTGLQPAEFLALPLVPLDAAVLNAELLQSTIRGMVRAAKTSRQASAGTLLLTDADRMPADAQGELAGFLKLVELPLRIMTTTTVPLERLAEAGAFRADLAAWLSVLSIEMPPLAARPEDIPPLAQWFVEELNAESARQLAGFTPEALDRLAAYAWPGDVAELAEMVRAAYARAEGPRLSTDSLPARLAYAADARSHEPIAPDTIDLDQFLAETERELIRRAVAAVKGNKTAAARLLGLSRPRLYRRMVQLELEAAPEDVVFEEADSTGENDERDG